jgi:hypothetical protein
LDTFIHGKSYVLIITKNGLGHILGDFVTNSSGHLDFIEMGADDDDGAIGCAGLEPILRNRFGRNLRAKIFKQTNEIYIQNLKWRNVRLKM